MKGASEDRRIFQCEVRTKGRPSRFKMLELPFSLPPRGENSRSGGMNPPGAPLFECAPTAFALHFAAA
jgi:hypothetical protein